MKKTIVITLFLAIVFCEHSFGQFSLGLLAGINQANVKFENVNRDSRARTGSFIGVAPSYQFSEKVQFQIDFQYSSKGFNEEHQKFKYEYLDIIPEIEFNVFEYLTLGVGMNYGIKLREQFKQEGTDWLRNNNIEIIKSTDFGLTGKLKTNYKNMFGFVRYNVGMKNITDVVFVDSNGQEINNAKILNRNLQIGIGYRINFKKD